MHNLNLLTSAERFIRFFFIRHNTSRVFADLQGNNSPVQTSYGAHYVGHALELSPLQSLSHGRKNKPHPNNVTFLRQNPRFICEPICHVKTSSDPKDTLHPWWPEEVPADKPIKVPQWSFDSTTRSDYFPPSTLCERSTRYCSNMANKPSVGIIPQCVKSDLNQTVAKEKISYEHQFNSRLDPSQPIRGRLHGSFIWKDVCFQKETGKCEESTLRDEMMTNGGVGNHKTQDLSNFVCESQPGSNN